jgi:hypothetical protein
LRYASRAGKAGLLFGCSMHLEACLTTADFRHAFAQLTPMRVVLDRDSQHRWLSLKPPSAVTIVAGQGLRIVTELQLQWDVIGIRVPITLRRVVIMLTPSVVLIEKKQALCFGLRIEDADLSAIPAFVGGAVIGLINEALAKADARIAWRFVDTLDFGFYLPPEIQPLYAMRVHARSGTVWVDERSVRLSVEWGLSAKGQPREATGA